MSNAKRRRRFTGKPAAAILRRHLVGTAAVSTAGRGRASGAACETLETVLP